MPEVFFIGDTHFGHEKILTFIECRKHFPNIAEHDEALIDNWNRVVTKRDVVYHLGDVVFGNSKIYKKLARLNGIKKLILGNHDKWSQLYPYFNSIHGALKYKTDFILTHIPVNEGQFERFRYNIHGHTHEFNIPDNRYINVSCEQINLTPISFDELKRKIGYDSIKTEDKRLSECRTIVHNR